MDSPVSPVPCAVIGTDGYAFELIKRLFLVPGDLRIVAACTKNAAGEGAARCREAGIPLVDEIAGLFDIAPAGEAVIFNATPIPLHFETTVACLRAGFHVALEKPPVPTVQELDALAAESVRCGRHVSVGFNYLYSNVCRTVRRWLAEGRIGRVKRLRGIAAWARPVDYYAGSQSRGRADQGGRPTFDGALGNPLSHVLSLMLSLASDGAGELAAPASVQAELYRARDYISSDDTASVRVTTASGVELILNLTVAAAEEIDPIIEIEGESGSAVITNFEQCELRPDSSPVETVGGLRESRVMMFEELAAARREARAPLVTLAACRPFTTVVNAAYESAGGVPLVPAGFRETREIGGRVFHCLRGIEEALRVAHGSGRLLSEAGCDWASTASIVPTANYARYPAERIS